MRYASGKRSHRVCDTCGFVVKYNSVKRSSYGTLVCNSCYDGKYDLKNHPQNFTPKNLIDSFGLKDPRPDRTEVTPSSLYEAILLEGGLQLLDENGNPIFQELYNELLTDLFAEDGSSLLTEDGSALADSIRVNNVWDIRYTTYIP